MSDKPLRSRCDVCGTYFDVDLVEELQPGGGVLIVFSCTNGHRFEVAKITARGLRLRDELNRLRDEAKPETLRERRRLQTAFEREYTGLAKR